MIANQFFARIAANSRDTIAACCHVFYPVSELAIFRQSACRKRQYLVGNNQALSASLSLATKNLPGSISRTYVPCRKKTSICLSVFVVLYGTLLRKKAVDYTFLLRLSQKRQSFVGNENGLSETRRVSDKAFLVLSLLNG